MKILVIDDHALIREALRGVLREIAQDATLFEAPDSREGMQRLAETPDVELILLDLALPDRNGFDVLADLGARFPATAVVVLSASENRDDIVRALELGAVGFIPKSARREVMVRALALIFSGGVYVPPQILARPAVAPARLAGPPPQASGRELGLTGRQAEVLALMMQGKSNKAICRALDLAEPTVKNHVTAILHILRASNRTEAVIAADALGFEPAALADRLPRGRR